MLERYYFPYRDWVETQVRARNRDSASAFCTSPATASRRASTAKCAARTSGSCTIRGATAEARFCSAWQSTLSAADPRLVVRRNYPYRGYADGLTTSLRRRFPDPAYAGVEIEVNQKYPLGDDAAWRALRRLVVVTLERALTRH